MNIHLPIRSPYLSFSQPILMISTQITPHLIKDNLYYAQYSDHDVGHPSWKSEYPLTATQCIQALNSKDMMCGYIRIGKNGCFCDMCDKTIGELHRPACVMGPQLNEHSIVGDMRNYNQSYQVPPSSSNVIIYASIAVPVCSLFILLPANLTLMILSLYYGAYLLHFPN